MLSLTVHRLGDRVQGPWDLGVAVVRLELSELCGGEEQDPRDDGFHHSADARMFRDTDLGGEVELRSSVVHDVDRAAPEKRAHDRALVLQEERGPHREHQEGNGGERDGSKVEGHVRDEPCDRGRHRGVQGDAHDELRRRLPVMDDVHGPWFPGGEDDDGTSEGNERRNTHEVPQLRG